MDSLSKETKAILKISKDTIEGKVEWSINPKGSIVLGSEEEIIDNAYIAEYHGKRLRLYRFRDKYYHDYLEYVWTDGYRLEVVDLHNNSLWEFPSDNAILGLYDSVRKKTSGVTNFLDDILGDV